MVHQTFVRWALYILYKIVKSLIRHLGSEPSEMSDMSDDFREHRFNWLYQHMLYDICR